MNPIIIPHRRKHHGGSSMLMPVSNADVFDFDCGSLAGWTNGDAGLGVSEVDIEDSNNVIRQYDTGYNAGNIARVFKDALYTTPSNSFVLSFRAKFDKAVLWDAADQMFTALGNLRIDDDGANYLSLGWRFYLDKVRALSGGNDYLDITTDITDWFWFTTKITYSTLAVTTDIYMGNGDGSVYETVAIGHNQFSKIAGSFDGYIRLEVIDRINEATRPDSQWDKIKVGSDFA